MSGIQPAHRQYADRDSEYGDTVFVNPFDNSADSHHPVGVVSQQSEFESQPHSHSHSQLDSRLHEDHPRASTFTQDQRSNTSPPNAQLINGSASSHHGASSLPLSSPFQPPSSSSSSSPSSSSSSLDRGFWFMFILLSIVLILSESSRGIVIPTLALYQESLGGSKAFLGALVAMFSVGRLGSSWFFGRYLSKSHKRASTQPNPIFSANQSVILGLLASLFIVFIGHIFYVSAASGGLTLLLLARLLVGFGTGTLVLARSFVGDRVPIKKKARFMAWLGIEQFIGFAFTPGLGTIQMDSYIGSMHWTTFNFGSYLLMILTFIAFVGLLVVLFKMRRDEFGWRRHVRQLTAVQDDFSAHLQQQPRTDHSETLLPSPADAESESVTDELRNDSKERTQAESFDQHTTVPSSPPSPSTLASSATGWQSLPSSSQTETQSQPQSTFSSPPPVSHAYIEMTQLHTSDSAESITSVPDVESGNGTDTGTGTGTGVTVTHSETSLLWLLVLCNLVVRGSLSIVETYGSLIYFVVTPGADKDSQVSDSAIFFFILGVGGVAIFFAVEYLTQYLTSRRVLILAFFIAMFGYALIMDFDGDLHRGRFIAGMVFVWSISSPIAQTVIAAELSTELSRRQRSFTLQNGSSSSSSSASAAPSQSVWMGHLTAAGSVGRIIFPLIGGTLYRTDGDSGGVMLFCLLAHLIALVGYGWIGRHEVKRDLRRGWEIIRTQPKVHTILHRLHSHHHSPPSSSASHMPPLTLPPLSDHLLDSTVDHSDSYSGSSVKQSIGRGASGEIVHGGWHA